MNMRKDKCIFTPADFITFLTFIDELKGYTLELRENFDGNLQIKINDNVYTIWDESKHMYF